MPRLDISDYSPERRQEVEDLRSLGVTDLGKRVIAALRKEYYDCPILPGDDLQFKLGQRDVVYQILEKIDGHT